MQAVELLARAPARKPPGETYRDLGMLLTTLGQFDDAAAAFRNAISINPADAETHNGLANTLLHLGRLAEAEASFREALCLQPDFPDARNNLAAALRKLGRPAEAEANCREALRLRPGCPQAHNNLGMTLNVLGRPAEAEASFREALRLRPDFAGAHNGLGRTLLNLDRPAEAEARFREARRLRPDFPDACNNLAAALLALGRPAQAEASAREALRLRPDFPQAHNNLGAAQYVLGRPAQAEASCREALRHRPDFPDAHSNLAMPLLLTGRFEEGWKEYEWRWKTKSMSEGVRDFPAPLWNGEAIGDRVILLHAEQGLGDALQFCRYAPLIASNATTILEVHAPLVRLLSRLPGIAQVVARGDTLPSFDLHCPLLSLPRAFGTTIDSIPAAIPYLTADPVQAEAWAERLSGLRGLRIGLVWAGSRHLDRPDSTAPDRRRSIGLNTMAPFGKVSGVSFISLQKGEPAAQSANPPRGLLLHDFTADLRDFADTAALIDGLDLVISVDTAVAHLAGALGKPVWLLNRFDTDWRWMLRRDDSPWYPTVRLFRQPSPGDWNSVICSVGDALKRLAAGDRDQLRPRGA